MSKDYSISFIRCISMLFIILCHLFQYYENEIAWWLNVGVQLFLFISGWLYANKKIDDYKKFYEKEFKKILIPYYIYLLVISLIYYFFIPDNINLKSFILSLLLIDTLNGLSHLWFIRYIILCYLLIPLINNIFKEKKMSVNSLIKLLTVFLVFELIGLVTKNFFNWTWINCFVLGFFVNRYKCDIERFTKLKMMFLTTSIFLISVKIIIKYCIGIKLNGIFLMIFNKYSNICHLLLCVLLFFLLKKIYSLLKHSTLRERILDLSDKYSYYIYITYHIFILGSLSLFKLIDRPIICIPLIVMLTLVSSVVLYLLTNLLKKIDIVLNEAKR